MRLARPKPAVARRTGNSRDHGVDVIVETPAGEKWVVQCKRWRGSVGEPAVGKPLVLVDGEEFLGNWREARQEVREAVGR